MTQDFSGRVVTVTGAASGIGRAAADLFAQRGASVVLADIDDDGGRQAEKAIRSDGGEATFVHVDVANADDVANMVAVAADTYGRLDCAFNNAGISTDDKPFTEHTADDWNRVIAVNQTGVFFCMQHQIRQMLTQGQGGAIVVTSSGAGHTCKVGEPQYSASKAAVLGLVRQAAGEYARQGIRVNAVLPGITNTPLLKWWADSFPQKAERVFASSGPGRPAEPIEVAQVVTWLCSDEASFVSGVEIDTDAASRFFKPTPVDA